jgi:hypothetical protein
MLGKTNKMLVLYAHKRAIAASLSDLLVFGRGPSLPSLSVGVLQVLWRGSLLRCRTYCATPQQEELSVRFAQQTMRLRAIDPALGLRTKEISEVTPTRAPLPCPTVLHSTAARIRCTHPLRARRPVCAQLILLHEDNFAQLRGGVAQVRQGEFSEFNKMVEGFAFRHAKVVQSLMEAASNSHPTWDYQGTPRERGLHSASAASPAGHSAVLQGTLDGLVLSAIGTSTMVEHFLSLGKQGDRAMQPEQRRVGAVWEQVRRFAGGEGRGEGGVRTRTHAHTHACTHAHARTRAHNN